VSQFEYHNAANDEGSQKKALAWVLANTAGKAKTGVLSGLSVAQTTTASASVVVAAGAGVVQAATLDGASLVALDTDLTYDVLTANPVGGLPRNDIIVYDLATLSALPTASGGIRAIIGTPNASPTDPTVPTSAIPLARLRHAASATTIPAAKIDSLIVPTDLFGVPYMQTGTVSLAGDATNQRAQAVTFPVPFTSTPTILLQVLTGMTLSSTTQSVWPSGESASGFTANCVRNNTTTVSVRWFAYGSR
jgi:hypothetical protein